MAAVGLAAFALNATSATFLAPSKSSGLGPHNLYSITTAANFTTFFGALNSSKTFNNATISASLSCIPPGPGGWTWDKLLITLIGTPMSFCTFVFNFITLLSFLKHSELRSEPSNWYIIHLAFCDMFTGLHSMPSTMIADVFPCYPFPLWFCRIDRILIWLVPQQSGTLVDLIAYDRMLMIMYGANYARRETMRVVQWKIAASWLYNLILFGLPNLLHLVTGHSLSGDGVCIEEIFQIAWFSGFIAIFSAMVPTLICGIIYVASAYLLKKRTETLAKADATSRQSMVAGLPIGDATVKMVVEKPRQNASARAREKREAAKRKRAFRFMAFMATAFLVCWFPSGIMIIIYTFTCTDQDVCKQNGMRSILQLTFYLFLSNSIIDPILYPFLMPKFRRLTIRMLTCGKRNYLFFKPSLLENKPQQPQPAGGANNAKPRRPGASGGRASGAAARSAKNVPASSKQQLHSSRQNSKLSAGRLTGSATRRAMAGVAAARLASPEHFGIDEKKSSKKLLKRVSSDGPVKQQQQQQTERRQSTLSSGELNRDEEEEEYGDDDYVEEEEEEEEESEDFDDDLTPDMTSPDKEIVWKKRKSLELARNEKTKPSLQINNNNLTTTTTAPLLSMRRTQQNNSPSHERFLSCIRAGQRVDNDIPSYVNGASGSPIIVELHTMSTLS